MSPQHPMTSRPSGDWDRLLDGRVAVVTGAGAGIGAAVSRLFAEHGARVEMAEVDADRARRTRTAIEDEPAARPAPTSSTSPRRPTSTGWPPTCWPSTGGSTCWSTTSGTTARWSGSRTSTPESWNAMYDVNLHHVFAVTRAFLGSHDRPADRLDRQHPFGGGPAGLSRRPGLRRHEGGGGPLHHQPGRGRGAPRGAGQRHRTRPDPDPPGRLPLRGRERRRPVGVLGTGGPPGLARGPGPGGPVPGLGPLQLRHRPQHPRRRRDQGRRRVVLLPLRRPVRQPAARP